MFKNALLLLALSALPLPPLTAQDSQPSEPTPGTAAAPAPLAPLPDGIAARAVGEAGDVTELTYAELDAVLLARHGLRPEGQDVLSRLLNMAVLQELSNQAGVVITDAALDTRIAEINAKLIEDGYEGGLAAQLTASDIAPDVFRSTFSISLAIEELTRIALGLPEGERPGNGQQQAWMDAMMKAREGAVNTDPFPSGDDEVVAYSDDVTVDMGTFRKHLRDELPRAFVEQSCSQLILEKRLRAMAGEVDAAEWQAAVDLEIGRRRARHAANPQTAGVSYEQLLEAQGLSLETIAQDPAVVVTALTTVLVWRDEVAAAEAAEANGATETDVAALRDAGLRILYENEKELFDGYYGERLHLRVCLLRAVEVPNEIVSRSVEEAHAYLGRLAPGIPDEEGFKLIVGKLTDDVGGRKSGGELGWFGRGDERLPAPIREAAFAYWDAHHEPGVAGPLNVSGGVAILWVGPFEPAPEWNKLAPAVQSELQARTLSAAMPAGGIHIFRDPPVRLAPMPEPAAE